MGCDSFRPIKGREPPEEEVVLHPEQPALPTTENGLQPVQEPVTIMVSTVVSGGLCREEDASPQHEDTRAAVNSSTWMF